MYWHGKQERGKTSADPLWSNHEVRVVSWKIPQLTKTKMNLCCINCHVTSIANCKLTLNVRHSSPYINNTFLFFTWGPPLENGMSSQFGKPMGSVSLRPPYYKLWRLFLKLMARWQSLCNMMYFAQYSEFEDNTDIIRKLNLIFSVMHSFSGSMWLKMIEQDLNAP